MTKQAYLILGAVFVLVLAGAVLVRQKRQGSVEPAPIPQPPVITPTQPTSYQLQPTYSSPTPEGWKTYENIKYKYSFSYPSSYYIYQFADFGVIEDISADADNMSINQTEGIGSIFSIWATDLDSLNTDSIKTRFAVNPEDIDLVAMTIADQPAYKIKFRKEDEGISSDFHFVLSIDNKVLKITTSLDNDTADKIFSTLRFTQ